MMIDARDMLVCVVCGASRAGNGRWARIRAWEARWYIMRDETVFCPDHRPPFATEPKPRPPGGFTSSP